MSVVLVIAHMNITNSLKEDFFKTRRREIVLIKVFEIKVQ